MSLKYYFKDKDRLADLLNYKLYEGKEVLSADDISFTDSTTAALLGNLDSKVIEAIERHRDVIALVRLPRYDGDPKDRYIMIGLENQSTIDQCMPLRAFEYDYLTYRDQSRALKDSKSHAPLIPATSLIFYCGDKRWEGPNSLLGMMDVHKDALSILSEHLCNLINIRELEYHRLNNEENKKFIEIVQAFYDGTLEQVECPVLSLDVAVLAATLIGNPDLLLKVEQEEGEVNMCLALEKILNEREAKGKAEAIKSIMKNLKLTFEQAVKALSVPESEYETYRSLIAA